MFPGSETRRSASMPKDNLPDHDQIDSEYPDTLRITIATAEDAFDEATDEAEAAESGIQTDAVVSFETAEGVRRLELLQSLMDDPAESITALAERVDRNYSAVHDDVDVLKAAGVVKFRTNGRSKQPFVPYETVEFDVTIRASASGTDTEVSA